VALATFTCLTAGDFENRFFSFVRPRCAGVDGIFMAPCAAAAVAGSAAAGAAIADNPGRGSARGECIFEDAADVAAVAEAAVVAEGVGVASFMMGSFANLLLMPPELCRFFFFFFALASSPSHPADQGANMGTDVTLL